MGSPNFYTRTDGLNLGMEYDYDEEDTDAYQDDITETFKAVEQRVSVFGTRYWHQFQLSYGYHNGFQVYIEPVFVNQEACINGVLSDWTNYKEFADIDGYDVDLADVEYFRKGIKNITATEMGHAIRREYKAMHNFLLEIGEELGLGEVVGVTWTSHLAHPIQSKRLK